ncbi:Hcp family type VI secretion system effector [Rhodovulum euryhalinum]|uniref:Type VI secretion system secreted protein Hcp n=1 Tax=Rhodovulum euryhalinum TaxID=35805 RepID=A0A4R2KDX2_9RHOB|nr:type VI secretion system tube protein Hcp [Rhodovulum euryhalinum]TCO70532.1 type VI secretion system secreted protein Hcp [Rhodovulum euryhalinum]
MTLNAYMKVPDIAGESKSAEHEDEIDLYDVNWLMEQESHAQVGSGRTRGRAQINPIYVSKWYDASSPYLALACMQGKSFDEIVIMFRKDSGDAHLDYLQITLSNTTISKYEIVGEYEATKAISEVIGLAAEKIKVKYIIQAEDHSAGDEHEIEYDIAAGR